MVEGLIELVEHGRTRSRLDSRFSPLLLIDYRKGRFDGRERVGKGGGGTFTFHENLLGKERCWGDLSFRAFSFS